VTSAAVSRRCGRVIGLAYLPPRLAQPGGLIQIRLEDGADITATVVDTPFFDPDGAQQRS
jgi:sarcosine oxidase subunit alpha